jgi:hypothetical protein
LPVLASPEVRHFCYNHLKSGFRKAITTTFTLSYLSLTLYHSGMSLQMRGNRGFRSRPRLALVAALVLALLAFPCGPVATAFSSEAGHAVAPALAPPAHAQHGESECAHRAKKHESSCCNSCSSWITSRFDDGTKAVISQPSHRELPATPVYIHLNFVGPDLEQRLTGPPLMGSLYGTRLYSRTQRFRI